VPDLIDFAFELASWVSADTGVGLSGGGFGLWLVENPKVF
jgi:hypothetical protein